MGNSSCCSFGGEDKNDVSVQQLAMSGLKQVSPQAFEAWLKRYTAGGSVEVLFPDGQRIECLLKLDLDEKQLSLAFKDKLRLIPFSDISSWIYGTNTHTQKQQQQQHTSADAQLLEDPHVVGFRLTTSGRAIAVCFSDVDAALCFVKFVEEILEEARGGEAHYTDIDAAKRA